MIKRTKSLLLVGLVSLALTLHGCSSSTGTKSAGGGYTYGSGPNKTKPMPQTEKVQVQGIKGAKPVYEARKVNRGTNKDYTVLGKNYMVWNGATSYIEEGIASWYGPGFHGKKTSTGEIYDQKGFTAAHKNLPLPAYVKVTNLTNGKKIIVRVNDRGPFVGTRIIDLSEGSARAIGMIGTGTAKVRLELIHVNTNGTLANAVGTPGGSDISTSSSKKYYAQTSSTKKANSSSSSFKKSGFYVQLVACNSDMLAEEIRRDASKKTTHPVIAVNDGKINRVLVGPLSDFNAQNAVADLRAKGFSDCFVKEF